MKRIKKQFVCLIVCAIVMSTMSGCLRVKRTEDLSDYLHTKVPLHYDHVLFPDKDQIPTNGVKLYRSESISSLMFDDIYFLLSCSYTDDAYASELERIKSCGAEYQQDLFARPAYVMVFSGNCFEYVLQHTEDNTLIYVYAQTADWNIFDNFPKEYRPLVKETVYIDGYSD